VARSIKIYFFFMDYKHTIYIYITPYIVCEAVHFKSSVFICAFCDDTLFTGKKCARHPDDDI